MCFIDGSHDSIPSLCLCAFVRAFVDGFRDFRIQGPLILVVILLESPFTFYGGGLTAGARCLDAAVLGGNYGGGPPAPAFTFHVSRFTVTGH